MSSYGIETSKWPTPNYVDPVTRGTPVVCAVLFALAVIVVCLRLYSRVVVTRTPGIDDIFIVFAIVFGGVQTVCSYKGLALYGWNRHLWDVPYNFFTNNQKMVWLIQVFFTLGTGCTKISVLLVYRRIAAISHTTKLFLLTWIAIVFTILYIVGFFVSATTGHGC